MLRAERVWAAGMTQPVSFTLQPGALMLVSGPSGSGKSRLLRALADLDPHEGRIWLEEWAQQSWPPCDWRRRVMYFPATPAWWAETPAATFESRPSAEQLAEIGLTPAHLERPVERLSSGEQQRLALLRGVLCQPQVLLLDEPTAHLDTESTLQVERWLLSQLAEGRMLIWISHDLAQQHRLNPSQHIDLASSRVAP